jgi:hypothetical protein
MEGPPTFVHGSCVPGGDVVGVKQIPPCSLRSLVGMTRILGYSRECAGAHKTL